MSPLSSRLSELARSPIQISDSLHQRLDSYWVSSETLSYWYGTSLVNDEVLNAMQDWVAQTDVISKFKSLFGENRLNPTENRGASHICFRDKKWRREWLPSIADFVNDIHSNSTYDTVIQVGIGGSELGPRAAYHALKRWAISTGSQKMRAKFIANLDLDDGDYVLSRVDLRKSLIIVASKSGSTLETHGNIDRIHAAARAQGVDMAQFQTQWVVVTTEGSRLAHSNDFGHSFFMDPGIGGRFSVTSAVGVLLLSLCFGIEPVSQFLDAACSMDQSSTQSNIRQNMALLSALIGVWDRSYRGLSSRAVIPYCEGLRFLPAHLQQLECESCGKGVSSTGTPIDYPTSPVVFGHTGTQAQHSFFQNFHQGTDSIPVEFVGVLQSQLHPSETQSKLLASLVSQISALAIGRHHTDARKHCPGNRPSTLVMMTELTPRTLGELLAYYENRTVFQGLLWDINPFDQEGVELGKLICQQVVSGESGFPIELFKKITELNAL